MLGDSVFVDALGAASDYLRYEKQDYY